MSFLVLTLRKSTYSFTRTQIQEEKGGMAPAVVKREGYRRSVYMTDQTPCAKCEGELMKKSGLSTKRVYCRLNNSYLNYYTGTKQNVITEGRLSKPDGTFTSLLSLSHEIQNHYTLQVPTIYNEYSHSRSIRTTRSSCVFMVVSRKR